MNAKINNELDARSTFYFATHVTQIATSNVIPNGYVTYTFLKKDNQKGETIILNVTSINNDFPNLKNTQNKPLFININAKKVPKATGIMDKQHEH